jgi:hypothetical protein
VVLSSLKQLILLTLIKQNKIMKKSIAKALFNSHSYFEYRKLITDLLKEEKSTGSEQSSSLTNYSLLNETRMNRLEDIKITPDNAQSLKSLKTNTFGWLFLKDGAVIAHN